jgi:multiple antibiotic resistance protein
MSAVHRAVHDYLVLFAMVNAFGNLPILWELTHAMDPTTKARSFRVAVLTACAIVVTFAFLGNLMLRSVFQVDVNAFRIAGGILVFAVAGRGVLLGPRTQMSANEKYENVAVFPMAFPFLAGPGTIVTTILLMQAEGGPLTALTAVLVYATILPLLHFTPLIERALGRVGALVLTRILYVFVASKAVAFVINGIRGSFGSR